MIDAETAPVIYIQAQADLVARAADLKAGAPHSVTIAGAEAE